MRAALTHEAQAEGVDLLVVGRPTQGRRPTGVTASLVAGIMPGRVRGTAVACFDNRFHKPRWLTDSAARVLAMS